MANLDDVLIFVKVAQFESISRAARSLGMPATLIYPTPASFGQPRCVGSESALNPSNFQPCCAQS